VKYASVGVLAFERCVLTRLEELKQSFGELKKSQALLTAKVDSLLQVGGGQVSTDLPEDIDLPITSVRGLQALDHRLAADTQLKQLMVSDHAILLVGRQEGHPACKNGMVEAGTG